MKLKDYLEETQMNISQFARWIGVSQSTVSKWLIEDFAKRTIPTKDHAVIVATKTGYRVLPNDFFDFDLPPVIEPSQRRRSAPGTPGSLADQANDYNEHARAYATHASVSAARKVR